MVLDFLKQASKRQQTYDTLKCCLSRQLTVTKATEIQNTSGLESELSSEPKTPAYYVYISNLSGQMKGLMTVLVRTLLVTNQA